MLCSLIHTETGSSSQYKLFSFEPNRLLQSLFGYHYLTLSLMERGCLCTPTRSNLLPGERGDCFVGLAASSQRHSLLSHHDNLCSSVSSVVFMFFQGRCHVCWTPQSMKMWYFQESHKGKIK